MTDIASESDTTAASADAIIAKLQARLVALADRVDDLSAAEIDRTASAISKLVRGLRDADAFIAERSAVLPPGHRPPEEDRIAFLRKLKRWVDQGVLDELEQPDG